MTATSPPAPGPRRAPVPASSSELAAVVAHDLLEPLSSVIGFLRLLRNRHAAELSPAAAELVLLALEGTANMAGRVDAVLDQARLGASQPRIEPVQLEAAVGRALVALSASVADSGAIVETDGAVPVLVDPALFDRVLQQLISNAIKFSRPGTRPRIRVSSAPAGRWCRVAVADNGIGVAPANRQRVFEMFVRAEPERCPGSGIGLAQCRAVVELHGGKVWIEDGDLGGTTVAMLVPVAP